MALLTIGIIDEDIGLTAAGRAIHALAIGIALPRRLDAVRDVDQTAGLDIQTIDGDGLVGPVAGRDQNHRLPAQHEAFAQVDIVHLAVGQMLDDATLHVIEVQPGLLVRADDQAVGRVVRIGPDDGIVGGVTGTADRRRFRHGDDSGKARRDDGARVLRRAGRQVQRARQGRDRHQFVVGALGRILIRHQQGARGQPGQPHADHLKRARLLDRLAAKARQAGGAEPGVVGAVVIDEQPPAGGVGGDQIARARAAVIKRQRAALFADPTQTGGVDQGRGGVGFRVAVEAPDADRLLRDVELARRIVGDTVFDLGRQVDPPRRARIDLALGIGVEQQLFDLAAVAHGHGIEAAVAGVAQQADVLDRKTQRHGARAHLDRRAVAHGEEAQGVFGLVGRDQQGLGLALDREAVAHVQAAGLARRYGAYARTRQVKDLQTSQTRRRHKTMITGVNVQHDHAAAGLARRGRIDRRGHDRSRRFLGPGGPADRHRQHHGAGPKEFARQSVGHDRLPHASPRYVEAQ
ncbi:hypothetical protein D3C85_837350 [compost metagenome]